MRAVKAQRSVVAMGDAQGAWGSGGASGAAGVAQCAMFKESYITWFCFVFILAIDVFQLFTQSTCRLSIFNVLLLVL